MGFMLFNTILANFYVPYRYILNYNILLINDSMVLESPVAAISINLSTYSSSGSVVDMLISLIDLMLQ